MQFTNPNGILIITDEYLEYNYNPSFTYELTNKTKPNYTPERIELSKIKTVDTWKLSRARQAMIWGSILAILGPIAMIKGNEDNYNSSSSIMFVAAVLFIIGACAAYWGWKYSKLPKAKMKGVRVFHYVLKTEKLLGIKESVIFVSDNDEEIQNVVKLLQSKNKSSGKQ